MKTEGKINCFICDVELDNMEYKDVDVHPMYGLHFRTYGHYGSTIFDPMNGQVLDIAICDECVKKNIDKARGSGVKGIIMMKERDKIDES